MITEENAGLRRDWQGRDRRLMNPSVAGQHFGVGIQRRPARWAGCRRTERESQNLTDPLLHHWNDVSRGEVS